MRKLILFLLVLSLLTAGALFVQADAPRIIDDADLLTDAQLQELSAIADQLSRTHNADIVIVTVNSLGSKSAESFADDYFDDHGYAVGVAKSSNGRVDGEWIQEETPIFSRSMTGKYDGGHGMIFTSLEGQKYLCIHSPNKPSPEREEVPVLIPIEEKNGTIVCIL